MKLFDYFKSSLAYKSNDLNEEIQSLVENTWPGAQIDEIEFVTNGRINLIYRLYLTQAPEERVILRIRVMDDHRYRQGFATESWVNQKLREHGIQFSPELFVSDDTRIRVSFDYSLMEEILGRPLELTDRPEVFGQVGTCLAEIHQISLDWFGKKKQVQVEPFQNGYDFYREYFTSIIQTFEKSQPVLGAEAKKIVEECLYREPYQHRNFVLLHHDYHSKNILLTDTGGISIIDWESARGGFAEVDLVKFKYLTLAKVSKEQQASFIQGYEAIRPLNFTKNFALHELIWLIKMYLFETDWPTDQREYFPDADHYLDLIQQISQMVYIWGEHYDQVWQNQSLSRKEKIAACLFSGLWQS